MSSTDLQVKPNLAFRFLYLVDAKKHISQNKIVAYEVLKVHEKFEE